MDKLKQSILVLMGCCLLILGVAVKATPIGFIDLGNSTVDTNTNMEWLDVNSISGTYQQVLYDISSDGGLFDVSDGWHLATVPEFRGLLANWFDTPDLIYWWDAWEAFTESDEAAVVDFVDTFTNTTATDTRRDVGGWLEPTTVPGAVRYDRGIVIDGIKSTDPTWPDTNDRLILAMANLSGISGAWLVRSALPISEPGALLLMGMGLVGLGLSRRKRRRDLAGG